MAASDLFDLCAEYLAACEDAVALSPAGPIARAFVSPGPPAWDCAPQLTVHAGGPSIGDTAPLSPTLQPYHRQRQTGTVNLVAMTATVLRCVPGMTQQGQRTILPEPAALTDAARGTLGDVWAIWNHLATLIRDGNLWAPDSREVIFDPAVALNIAGGHSGWQIQVRVQLGGYRTGS